MAFKQGTGVLEIAQAETALAEMEGDIRASLRQKSRLADLGTAVAKISHDLRNMLASAQLMADRLEGMHWVAHTQQLNKGWMAPLSEQGSRRLIAKHRPAWVKTKKPVLFRQLEPDDFRKETAYTVGVEKGAPKLDDTAIKSFAKGVKAGQYRGRKL